MVIYRDGKTLEVPNAMDYDGMVVSDVGAGNVDDVAFGNRDDVASQAGWVSIFRF